MFEIFKTFFVYRVFIKYCVLSEILKYVPDSGLYRFPLSVSVCVHNGRSNTSAAAELAELRKNHNIVRKNTIFNQHHVYKNYLQFQKLLADSLYILSFHKTDFMIFFCLYTSNHICTYCAYVHISSV